MSRVQFQHLCIKHILNKVDELYATKILKKLNKNYDLLGFQTLIYINYYTFSFTYILQIPSLVMFMQWMQCHIRQVLLRHVDKCQKWIGNYLFLLIHYYNPWAMIHPVSSEDITTTNCQVFKYHIMLYIIRTALTFISITMTIKWP